MGAGALAATGLAIIPYKRMTLKKAFNEKLTALREQLKSSLSNHFSQELKNSVRKLEDNIAPYTRFILSEKEKLDKTEGEFAEIHKKLSTCRASLNTWGTKK